MEKKEKRTFKQFFMDNNKRNLKITITVVCVVLALLIIGGGIYIGSKLGLITIDRGSNGDPEGTFAPEEQNIDYVLARILRAAVLRPRGY